MTVGPHLVDHPGHGTGWIIAVVLVLVVVNVTVLLAALAGLAVAAWSWATQGPTVLNVAAVIVTAAYLTQFTVWAVSR